MRRMVCGCVAVLALCALPQMAAARGWTAAIHGGVAVPSGDFASRNNVDVRTGWALGGSEDYVWNDNWAFGVDGAWNAHRSSAEGQVVALGGGATSTRTKDKFETWQLGGHARYLLPTSGTTPIRWYGLLGAGLYGFNEKVTEEITSGGTPVTTSRVATDKRAGMKFGLGGVWWTNSQMGVNFGAEYNVAFLARTKREPSSLQYLGAQVGLTFNIPSAGPQ